ncbi:MAG: hypothetical protein FJW39_32345 [Acidobacteria bacterium]|nr:hypothetical protein [Acidobacteriota bacterium]
MKIEPHPPLISVKQESRLKCQGCVRSRRCLFIPLLGIQHDEALIAPLLYPESCGPAESPFMLMSYIGSLKAWLYLPVFRFWPPGPWPLRLPALLLAACAIVVAAGIAGKLAGRSAAIITAALLATDSIYLLTAVFDWGPVVLQHLLLGTAIWCALHGRPRLAAFAIGLTLWNKAIAIWYLAGLALAAAIFARRRLLSLDPRQAAACLLALLAGASPLLIYNADRRLATVHQNSAFNPSEIVEKARVAQVTLNGSALFDYMVPEPVEPGPRENLLTPALAAALAAGLLLSRRTRRITLFLATAIVASSTVMALTGGGGGAHHVVLLWPAPQLIIAIAASRALASRHAWIRATAAVGVLAVLASNLPVTHRYYFAALRSGGAPGWSRSLLTLGRELSRLPQAPVVAADWGIQNGLCLAYPDLAVASAPLSPDRDYLDALLANREILFVRSLGRQRFYPQVADHLIAHAAARGMTPAPILRIHDSAGTPAFEVIRFE